MFSDDDDDGDGEEGEDEEVVEVEGDGFDNVSSEVKKGRCEVNDEEVERSLRGSGRGKEERDDNRRKRNINLWSEYRRCVRQGRTPPRTLRDQHHERPPCKENKECRRLLDRISYLCSFRPSHFSQSQAI